MIPLYYTVKGEPMHAPTTLHQRFLGFRDAGLITALPTRFQVLQGELEMWPSVISTDVTEESAYGGPLAHPIARQPVILSEVGLDHFHIGTGLGADLASTCTHLHMTLHRGMPVWDLQLVATHPGGLEVLRQSTEALLVGDTPRARRVRRKLAWFLPEAESYHRQFLGDDGWIARAERFEFRTAMEAGCPLPEEFFSLVGFMNWAAVRFPAQPRDVGWVRMGPHLVLRATRRFREGQGFGWIDALRGVTT
jgi:hypothetical protein